MIYYDITITGVDGRVYTDTQNILLIYNINIEICIKVFLISSDEKYIFLVCQR